MTRPQHRVEEMQACAGVSQNESAAEAYMKEFVPLAWGISADAQALETPPAKMDPERIAWMLTRCLKGCRE